MTSRDSLRSTPRPTPRTDKEREEQAKHDQTDADHLAALGKELAAAKVARDRTAHALANAEKDHRSTCERLDRVQEALDTWLARERKFAPDGSRWNRPPAVEESV